VKTQYPHGLDKPLVGVECHTLEQIMRLKQHIHASRFRFLGKMIAKHLKWLQEEQDLNWKDSLSTGQVMQLVSIDDDNNNNNNGTLSLVPCHDITMDRLFPKKEVVSQLLLLPHSSSLKASDGT
jgi:hypothetical protein